MDVFKLTRALSKINPAQLVSNIVGRADIRELIIKLNTEDQLLEHNENAFGIKLYTIGGNYSPSYARSKRSNPKDIDLNKSGRYYRTFKVTPLANGNAKITSNNKIHGTDSYLAQERWGEVEGLNKENTAIVHEAMWEEVIKYLGTFL